MIEGEIFVEVRLVDGASKLKAYADVKLQLGTEGSIRLNGFSVFQNGSEEPRVAPPARKGKQRYFDSVLLEGPVREKVGEAIKAEYEHSQRAAGSGD